MDFTDNITDPKGINRLTLNARRLIGKSYEVAESFKYKELLPIHLFYSMMKDSKTIVNEIFSKIAIDVELTLVRIETEFNLHSGSKVKDVKFSEDIKKLIKEAFIQAFNLNHIYVGSEHLLLAMFTLGNVDFIEDLKKVGINHELIKKTLLSLGNYSLISSFMNDGQNQQGFEPQEKVSSYFSRNMNEISQNSGYPNITGRDEEIKRLIHILARKTKNNPILVGDAGVGKTAIVEGFVNLISAKKVPASFLNKKVISLDIGSILSGAKLRGDVEERVNSVINEAMADGNTIIFIDEIHNIVGAGSAGGKDSMDIANMLKPYLTNSTLSIIGATTADEYSKYFETDSALTRRFQPINVDELSIEAAKEVIFKITPDLEAYHNVRITKDSVDLAVDLSSKFIKDRYLPDKAIDIIDEAAASIKVGREIAMEPELSELGDKLMKIQKKKSDAVEKNNFELAASLKEEEEGLIDEIEELIEGKKKTAKKYARTVTEDLIKDVIVEWTKIPIAAADISDKKLKNLGSNLKKRIVGQDRVIDSVAKAVQRTHLGLSGDKRPLASFMFLGPTGVGKTELAKSVARELFGSENMLHQVNMSEFMEMHSISKLIGSPPGYVGYQEGGQLTTFVKRRPYSVILFDEIEKAHSDVLNILLQILDEGELTDSKGLKISFKNTIIIMTSNIGADEISEDNKLGFDIAIEKIDSEEVDQAYEDMREQIMSELKDTLRPELINRVDLIDIFRGLNKEDCLKIAALIVDEFKVRLLSKGILLEVSEDVITKINEEGYSKEYGGRNIRRKVQEILENGLSEFVLGINLPKKRRSVVKISADIKKDDVTFHLKRVDK